jgi:hypothetical protein
LTAVHLLREAAAPGRQPKKWWPSWAKGKDLQALDKRDYRIAKSLAKPYQQVSGQLVSANGRDQVSGQTPIVDRVREKLKKVPLPTLNCGAPYPAKSLEPLKRNVRILSLPKGADQQHHRRPVDPATPKPHRWRQYPVPASICTAA